MKVCTVPKYALHTDIGSFKKVFRTNQIPPRAQSSGPEVPKLFSPVDPLTIFSVILVDFFFHHPLQVEIDPWGSIWTTFEMTALDSRAAVAKLGCHEPLNSIHNIKSRADH